MYGIIVARNFDDPFPFLFLPFTIVKEGISVWLLLLSLFIWSNIPSELKRVV